MISIPCYTLTDRIHVGESAILYRGYRDADRAPVALKVPRSEPSTPRDVARLRHEYTLIRDLKLKGVVNAIALEKYDGGVALVMEDLGGRSLAKVLEERSLDLATKLEIGISLAGTLGSIHEARVIHKDVKPANILFNTETREIKLIDFGIATRLPQETHRAEPPDALEGTLAYVSPEQTGRMNRHLDHRTDLYSLGVTLYEMLTGALPFPLTHAMDLVHSHIARQPVPPHEVCPDVPEAVSAIVLKLMAKGAEDRYQSGSGLRADLEECLRQWNAHGRIEPFQLGRQDRTGDLRIPQKLYGREAQVQVLMDAAERVSRGATELLLIKGHAGVGKSALVNEIHRAVARWGGRFITGKFEQLNRSVPYAPIVQAFRELCRQILTEDTGALSEWKAKLTAALQPGGHVITSLVPELTLIVGEQPAVPAPGPTEAQSRMSAVFQRFLHAVARAGDPLFLFLDDLQWADAASMKLLHALLTDPDGRNVLIIGAYRDGEEEELDASHPLTGALAELRKSQVSIGEVALGPLDFPDLLRLVADTISCDEPRALPLARVLAAKTHGNPFFLSQLMVTLHQRGLIRFDAGAGSWAWDLAGIGEVASTDNVVTFMASKLCALRPATLELLTLAACIGHEFRLSTLSLLRDAPQAVTAAELWPALEEGFVLPLDPEYRFLHGSSSVIDGDAAPGDPFDVSYRFLHDRVQQAAYSLLEEPRRQEVHLRLGRLMWARGDGARRDEDLFEVVNHLNVGGPLIADRGERVSLARLNLAAGRRAKVASAHEAALSYMSGGIAAIGPEVGWDEDYELCFALHAEQAECAALSGRVDEAGSLCIALLARAKTMQDRVQVQCQRILLHTRAGQFVRCLEIAREELAAYGVTLPASGEECQRAMGAELAEVEANLAGRGHEELLEAPLMTDPIQLTTQRLLENANLSVRYFDPALFMFISIRQVNISLKHGHSKLSPNVYSFYGILLAFALGRPRDAHAFGMLALELNDRLGGVEYGCKLNATVGTYLHVCSPVQTALLHLERACSLGVELGDYLYVSVACDSRFMFKFGLGEELGALREEVEKNLALLRRTQVVSTVAAQTIAKQTIASLQGRTRDPRTLSDDAFDEPEFVASLERDGLTVITCWYCAMKAQLLFLFEDYSGVLAMAAVVEQNAATSEGMYFMAELAVYTCLALLALYPEAGAQQQREYLERIGRIEAKVALWVEGCPANYLHKQLMIAAERARIEGDVGGAMDMYERAALAASASGFVRDETLINELCARFHLLAGRRKVARPYMTEAYHGYLRWGAVAKAEHLADRYPHLVSPSEPGQRYGEERSASPLLTTLSAAVTTTRRIGDQIIDVATVVRAAQAIAGEVVLENVLYRLMRIVIENAGATKGFLLLERGGQLTIVGSMSVGPEDLQLNLLLPVERSEDLPLSIVQYVARTRETVILGRATRENRFAADPYIVRELPKSILCHALVRQGRLTGVLYLENDIVAEAFSQSRIDLLTLLCSQAAIAVENAILYDDVRSVTEQLRRSNEALEVEVASRTEQLSTAKERLELELVERERSERERAALQGEVIRAQSERLAELSTPIIPITERIMVMPLIGTMDKPRAQQVLETALHEVEAKQAQVVILDITGVRLIDNEVAATLLKTASALRLLGAEAVITGIRPDVAQTLVTLGIELNTVVTHGSLQKGITYALQRCGGDGRLSPGRGRALAT